MPSLTPTTPAKVLPGALAAAVLVACSHGGAGLDPGGTNPDEPVVSPEQQAKVDLGFKIFFDERMSRPRGVACGTCHDPFLGWGDGRPQGKGIQDNSLDSASHDGLLAVHGPKFKTFLTSRNTPTIYNAHLFDNLFWDGRAGDTHHQGQFPFEAGPEMNSSWDEHILPLMNSEAAYTDLFEAAYGGGVAPSRALGADAIGAYMDTISVFDTPFDALLAGDENALTAEQRKGHDLFFGKAGCFQCHPSPLLTDGGFHNTGVPSAGSVALNINKDGPDYGHGKRTDITALPEGEAVPHDDPEDYMKFKVPQLRMVAVTGPYMHNGAFDTLEEVIEFYDAGGGPDLSEADPFHAPTKDPRIVPLGLTGAEKSQLLSFLEEALLGPEIK